MHSSIFSFRLINCGPVMQILIPAVLLLVGYAGFIELARPQVVQMQSQQIDNLARVERLLYPEQAIDTVIVGSSLANKLPDSALGPGVYNIALNAGSPLTGLELVRRMEVLPRVVLVEINKLEIKADQAFVERLYHPFWYPVRRYVRAFRHRYQPVNLLQSWLVGAYYYLARRSPSVRQPPLNTLALERRLDNLKVFRAKAWLEYNLPLVRAEIERLRSRGVSVYLLEMPVHPRVANSTAFRGHREIVRQVFPESKYRWLSFNMNPGPVTRDGIHLTPGEADRFARALGQVIPQLP